MEDPQSKFLKSVIDLGNNFLNVFTSFGDIVSKVLGFSTETKKSDVGAYFKTVQDTIQGTKDKLNKIVADMKREGNPNASATETAVKTLIDNTLDKIIDGAKTVSEAIGDAGDSIGDVVKGGAAGVGTKAEEASVKPLSEGIGKIVDVVLGKEGSPDAGDDKKAEDGSTARGNDAGEAGKLFGNAAAVSAAAAKKSAADAVKAVGAVTGADILQAIVKNGDAAKLAKNNGAANAISVNAKDGTIAGGIVLRAMAKGGKFANVNNGDADAEKAVKGAAVSAVTKALDTLTIAIRKTIDAGLKIVKEAIKINANDTPISPEQSTSKAINN
ncbi:Variable large protein (plasmid) [Borrelia hermsii]|uniref:Variable large protein n=1 Tax=Borrelia hermsii TaxID=140 RepID=A0AAN0X6G0_BORHE|nr:Variable large protein [Borrelia hermsii]UPA08378.1 variable large family protein [Borrelia hermsii DAH]